MYLNTLKHFPSAIRLIPNHRPVSKTAINLSVLETPSDQCRDLKEFKQILSQGILTGFIKDTFVSKRLLQFSTDYFSQFIHLDYSYKILNVIENPDASIYNIMMMAYVKRNYPHRAIPFYKLMLNRNVGPNVYSYPFLVEACAIRGSKFEGKQVHNHVLKLGFDSDVDVRSTLVDMYADCSMLDDARKVFDEGPMIGSFIWHSLLEVYIRCWNEAGAEYLYNLMPKKDTIASHFMIVNFRRSCSFEKHDKLINEIPKNDTESWSGLIYCFQARNREMYEEAFELFISMHADGVAIDELVVKGVAHCFVKFAGLGYIEMMGKQIHSLIVKIGIESDVKLQNSLIAMYSAFTASKKKEEEEMACSVLSAEKLFNAVPWFGKYSWKHMLSGYLRCGFLENAKALFESRPEKICTGSWTLMIRYYSRHGCFLEGLVLFQEMMRSGIRLDEDDWYLIIIHLPYLFDALDLGTCIHAHLIKNGYSLKHSGNLSAKLFDLYTTCGYKAMKDERDWQ